MALPVVAIIGRPNVGKSSLLNALAGEMISIVEPTAGVTRDRVSTIIGRDDRYFELVDTGGYGGGMGILPVKSRGHPLDKLGAGSARDRGRDALATSDPLSSHIEQQIFQAIESANLVLFMVDIRDGLVPLDEQIAQLLRKSNLSVIGVANKADTAKMFPAVGEFSRLGFGDFLCVSVKNNLNKAVLLDRIFDKIAHIESHKPTEPVMKLAVVGKRNAGKSTLVNAIVGSERVIVSETPGTTRDAIDVRFEKDGKTIVVIDTAGVRKKSKLADSIEFYSYVRATHSIQRADVVLFLIDAAVPVSQVDKKLAKFIADECKSCILIVNKWDLAKKVASTGDYQDYLTKLLPGLWYAPIAFTTATEARNVQGTLDLAAEIFKQATTWIPTAKLNKAFDLLRQERTGGSKGAKKGSPRIYYATQVAVNPITLLMFVNKPELFDENHRRTITNRLRSMLPIEEVPIRLLVRSHRTQERAAIQRRSR